MNPRKNVQKYVLPHSHKPYILITALIGIVFFALGFFFESDRVPFWAIGGMIDGLCLIGYLYQDWREGMTTRALDRLEALGLAEEAARQLRDPGFHRFRFDGTLLTDDFLFSERFQIVLPYSDILWCYLHYVRQRHWSGYILMAGSTAVEPRQILSGAEQAEKEEVLAFIASRNPQVMTEDTIPNALRYRKLVDQANL